MREKYAPAELPTQNQLDAEDRGLPWGQRRVRAYCLHYILAGDGQGTGIGCGEYFVTSRDDFHSLWAMGNAVGCRP